jgi:hypothetical protein
LESNYYDVDADDADVNVDDVDADADADVRVIMHMIVYRTDHALMFCCICPIRFVTCR